MQLTDVAPDDLFITEELDARPCGAADYRQETLAIQELAARMADDPDAVLPKFVELAMEITGGVAGGLSLFEAGPEPVFRWTGLRGSLEEFDGAATPRHFSPCGVTLDRNGVVLCRHPERFYDWVPQHLWLPEVLLVPLYMGGTEPLGTLWVVAGKPEHFTRDHARILGELAAFVGIAVRMRRGQQALRQELADQVALTQEMSHRVRNVFAVTDGMIRISAKNAADKDEMARSLSGRLHALSSAHALVSRNLHRDENRQQGDIASLLRAVTAPHETGIGAERFHVAGPVIVCGDHAMTGLALIFHEMATNSAKYGAPQQRPWRG